MLKCIYLNIRLKILFTTADSCRITEYSSGTNGKGKKPQDAARERLHNER